MSIPTVPEPNALLTYVDPEEAAATAHSLDKQNVAVESNVRCCLCVCICGVVFDALYALPGVDDNYLPSSLRTTSIVLCVLLGAPPISPDYTFILEQRATTATLLAIAAFVGLNRAETAARNADAVFCLVATSACVLAIGTNGVTAQTDSVRKQGVVREHLTAFVAAILFYLGMRTIRHAFALPSELQGFTTGHFEPTSIYGVVSDVITAANAFSGALTVCFAVIMLLNFDLVLHAGAASMSTVAGTLASFVFTSAFVAQLYMFSLLKHMDALFGPTSCDGARDTCEAAFKARRFFLCSNIPALPWVCAIVMATFAYSNRAQFNTRRAHFLYAPEVYTASYLSIVVAFFITFGALLFLVNDVDRVELSDIELMLLLLSIPMVLLHRPITGATTHLSGYIIYISTRVASQTVFSWAYFTHHCIFASAFMLAVLVLLSMISFGLYTIRDERRYAEPVEVATAVLSTALLSVQTFLTLSTLAVASGYTGLYYEPLHGSWTASGYEYSVQHSVSFFFAAAFYASRYEHAQLTRLHTRLAWLAPPPLLGLVWWMYVLIFSETVHDPYTPYVDIGSFSIGISSVCIAWAGVGICLTY